MCGRLERCLIALLLVVCGGGAPCSAALLNFISTNPRPPQPNSATDTFVREGHGSADIVCAFCNLHLHTDVRGDVAVLFGSVEVDQGRTIGGDVALLGGDITLAEGATVKGDAAVLAGHLRAVRGASVLGDRAVLPGKGWLLLPLVPLLIFAGMIWLIVWLVRRARYGAPMMRRY